MRDERFWLGEAYSPNAERAVRKALREAHPTDLVNEALKVIGRERWELKDRLTSWAGRSDMVDSVAARYSGFGQEAQWARHDLLQRLYRADMRRRRIQERRELVAAAKEAVR